MPKQVRSAVGIYTLIKGASHLWLLPSNVQAETVCSCLLVLCTYRLKEQCTGNGHTLANRYGDRVRATETLTSQRAAVSVETGWLRL